MKAIKKFGRKIGSSSSDQETRVKEYNQLLAQSISTVQSASITWGHTFNRTPGGRGMMLRYLKEHAMRHEQGKAQKSLRSGTYPTVRAYSEMAQSIEEGYYNDLVDVEVKKERLKALAVVAKHTFGEDTVLDWERQDDNTELLSDQYEGEDAHSNSPSRQDDQTTSKGDTSNEEHFQDMSNTERDAGISLQMKARLKQEGKAINLADTRISRHRTPIEPKPDLPPLEAFSESFAGITVRDFEYSLPSSPYVSGGLTGEGSYREEGGVLILNPKDENDEEFGVVRSDFYEWMKNQDTQTDLGGDVDVEPEAGEATQAEAEGSVETETSSDPKTLDETARSADVSSQGLEYDMQSGPRGILKPRSKEGSYASTDDNVAAETAKTTPKSKKTVQFEGVGGPIET